MAWQCSCQTSFGTRLDIVIPDIYFDPDWTGHDTPKMAELYKTIRYNKGNPLWSPDGKWIVFTDSNFNYGPYFGPYGIWMVAKTGGQPILLYDNYNTEYLKDKQYSIPGMRPLCFTPDGSELTFRKMTVNESKGSEIYEEYGRITVDNPYPVIYNVNVTTKQVRKIIEGAYSGCWSPDGGSFVFIREDEIGIMNEKTDEERIVVEINDDLLVQPDTPAHEFLISRYHEIYSVPLSLDTCTLDLFMISDFHCLSFITVFSPDREWEVYIAPRIQSQEELCAFNAYSGESVSLIQNNTSQYLFKDTLKKWGKTWAPDGNALCYELYQMNTVLNDYTTELYVIDFDLESRRPSIVGAEAPVSFGPPVNYPNPFNLSTTIWFSLRESGFTDLVIYDMIGRKVRELISGPLDAGVHSAVWDGSDDHGNQVSSGIYISRLRTKDNMKSGRMMLVK